MVELWRHDMFAFQLKVSNNGLLCDKVGFNGTLVSGVGSFRFLLAGSPPFCPRPLGNPVLANAE